MLSNLYEDRWSLEACSLGRDRAFSFFTLGIGRKHIAVACGHAEATSFIVGKTMMQCVMQVPLQVLKVVGLLDSDGFFSQQFGNNFSVTDDFIRAHFLARMGSIFSENHGDEPGFTIEVLHADDWFFELMNRLVDLVERDRRNLSVAETLPYQIVPAAASAAGTAAENGQKVTAVLTAKEFGASKNAENQPPQFSAGGNVIGGRYSRIKKKHVEKPHRDFVL